MTMYYRCTQLGDLKLINNELWVMPKDFKSNPDSTIPSGTWSFWLDKLQNLSYWTHAIVGAEFTPEMEGVMKATVPGEEDVHGYMDYETYELNEFVVSKPVKVQKIWVKTSVESMLNTYKDNFVQAKGQDWVDSHIRDTFPHLTVGELYSWDIYGGSRLSSFKEVLSGKSFVIPSYPKLDITDRELMFDYLLLSIDLLPQGLYQGSTKEIPYFTK